MQIGISQVRARRAHKVADFYQQDFFTNLFKKMRWQPNINFAVGIEGNLFGSQLKFVLSMRAYPKGELLHQSKQQHNQYLSCKSS
jgi:hypothetical protein